MAFLARPARPLGDAGQFRLPGCGPLPRATGRCCDPWVRPSIIPVPSRPPARLVQPDPGAGLDLAKISQDMLAGTPETLISYEKTRSRSARSRGPPSVRARPLDARPSSRSPTPQLYGLRVGAAADRGHRTDGASRGPDDDSMDAAVSVPRRAPRGSRSSSTSRPCTTGRTPIPARWCCTSRRRSRMRPRPCAKWRSSSRPRRPRGRSRAAGSASCPPATCRSRPPVRPPRCTRAPRRWRPPSPHSGRPPEAPAQPSDDHGGVPTRRRSDVSAVSAPLFAPRPGRRARRRIAVRHVRDRRRASPRPHLPRRRRRRGRARPSPGGHRSDARGRPRDPGCRPGGGPSVRRSSAGTPRGRAAVSVTTQERTPDQVSPARHVDTPRRGRPVRPRRPPVPRRGIRRASVLVLA